MAIPGRHVMVKGEIEETITNAWPNQDNLPRVIFLCHQPDNGGPYREIKLKTKYYPNPIALITWIGQIEADHLFASTRRKWNRVIFPHNKHK